MNAPSPIADAQRVKLRIDDYLLLDRSGALAAYGRTELVDGVILALSPQFLPHGYAKAEIAYRLRRALEALGSPLYVLTETSMAIPAHGLPEPDIALSAVFLGEGTIPVSAVALIVEVSASTLATDLGSKAEMYALGGVPEYWVVDLDGRAVHQMWSPGLEGYGERREVGFGERLKAEAVPGVSVETSGLS